MIRPSDETPLMTRYLLGEATEQEQSRLEEQFFTDDPCHQQLLALEDELRYDYAQGGLTPHQRKLFEARYLADQAGKERAALAKAVMEKPYEEAERRGV